MQEASAQGLFVLLWPPSRPSQQLNGWAPLILVGTPVRVKLAPKGSQPGAPVVWLEGGKRTRACVSACVRACKRPPAARPSRGAPGGGATLRPGLTCSRSLLPFPAAAGARGYSGQASERVASEVPRRTYGGPITSLLDSMAGRTAQLLELKLLPQASSSPSPPTQTHPPRRASVSSKPNPTPCAYHVIQGSPIIFAPLSLVLLATWPFGKGGG